jgi:hypothetical protein
MRLNFWPFVRTQDVKSEEAKDAHEHFESFYWNGAGGCSDSSILSGGPDPVAGGNLLNPFPENEGT